MPPCLFLDVSDTSRTRIEYTALVVTLSPGLDHAPPTLIHASRGPVVFVDEGTAGGSLDREQVSDWSGCNPT